MINKRSINNILVTGGAGFIGSAFIRYLLNTSFSGKVVNFDLLTYAGNPLNLTSYSQDPRYLFYQGNICDEGLVETICQEQNIDTILHLAAESHVDRSILGPKPFVQTNVLGTFHLLEVVRKHPHIHFHHVSTDEVYGSLGKTGRFTEKSPYNPSSPYSASKAASDHFVNSYAKTYGLSTCISNCSNNFGPCQFPEKLIPLMTLNCLKRKPLPIYGTGTQIRDWLFVDDHAEALYLLLQQGKKGETYNIGGDTEKSNREVVHEIIETVAKQKGWNPDSLYPLIKEVEDRPGHDFRYAINASKIQKEMRWYPKHSFEQGLTKTVQWYLENQEWVAAVEAETYQEWMETRLS